MTKIQITVLVENTTRRPGLLAEHGIAYWIEYDGHHVLLDAGQGDVLVRNVNALGIVLHDIDALVLSHGHCDHTGGVADALRTDRPVTIYAHPAAFVRKFVRNSDGSGQEIGMPYVTNGAIRAARNRLVATDRPTTLFDGLMATGPVPRRTDFEDTGGAFFLDEGCTQPDPLEDDQSLFFDTADGTVVLLGCAHAGVVNTLRHICQLTNNRPICTVIGGMHLISASGERIKRTIEEFRQMGVERVAPAHCAGLAATMALWSAFPGRCMPCSVGTEFEFERKWLPDTEDSPDR
jgi:7,8-dihydropterin-6-yl-methyl-4-(beta-D-ribofuranosyl)aminobenzene 5'-phosphate synthase